MSCTHRTPTTLSSCPDCTTQNANERQSGLHRDVVLAVIELADALIDAAKSGRTRPLQPKIVRLNRARLALDAAILKTKGSS